jgi:hypothetical protein
MARDVFNRKMFLQVCPSNDDKDRTVDDPEIIQRNIQKTMSQQPQQQPQQPPQQPPQGGIQSLREGGMVGNQSLNVANELRQITSGLRDMVTPVYREKGSPREGEKTRFLPNFLPNLRERGYFDPNFYMQKFTGSAIPDFFSEVLGSDTSYSRSRAKNIKRAAALKVKRDYEKLYGADAVNYQEYNDAVRDLEQDNFDTSDFTGEKPKESIVPGQKLTVDDRGVPTFQPEQTFPTVAPTSVDPALGPKQTDPLGVLNEEQEAESIEKQGVGTSGIDDDDDDDDDVTTPTNNEIDALINQAANSSKLIGANLITDSDAGKKDTSDLRTRMKDRAALYKEILGEDEASRKSRAFLVLAQAAANVAEEASKTDRFGSALARGLKTLPLGLAKASAATSQRDLAIKTAALSAVEAEDAAKAKALGDLNKALVTADIKNLSKDGVKARNIAVRIGQLSQSGVNPFTFSSVKSYMPLLEKEGYLAKGGLPGDIIVANNLLGLPVGTFVSVSKQRDVNKGAINSVYAPASFNNYADALEQFKKGEISQSELDAVADKNAFGDKVGVSVTTNEKRVLDKKDVIENNYKVIRKIDKIIKEFKDTYGPNNAISRMFSKLTVPFIGDQQSYFADAKKIAAEKNFPQFRKFIRRIDDEGGMRLKAEYKLEELEFKDLEPGFLSSVEVAIDGMLDRRNDAANNIIEASAEIDPQFNQIARYIKRTAKGTENDPFSISDLQHPEIKTTIEQAGLQKRIFYYRLPNSDIVKEVSGEKILNLK